MTSHRTLRDPELQAHRKGTTQRGLGSLPGIHLPVLCPCRSDAFAKLLESGDLSMSSIKVDGISMSFQNLLAKICFHHHFSGKRWGVALNACAVVPLLLLASGGLTRALCCSGGESRLLRLHVQPLYPGPPRLPPGEKGEPRPARALRPLLPCFRSNPVASSLLGVLGFPRALAASPSELGGAPLLRFLGETCRSCSLAALLGFSREAG